MMLVTCLAFVRLHQMNRFMEDVDKEISEMKLSLNARARIVAESYLVTVSQVFHNPSHHTSSLTRKDNYLEQER
jgi:predicted nucleotidyltransferase component of viral defense system